MARTDTAVKRRIEAKYEHGERSIDSHTDHVGQMTIAFCAGDCLTAGTCIDTG